MKPTIHFRVSSIQTRLFIKSVTQVSIGINRKSYFFLERSNHVAVNFHVDATVNRSQSDQLDLNNR